MEPILTETEGDVAAAADRLCRQQGGAKRLRARRDGGGAPDREAWAAMVEAGWTGLIEPPGQAGTLGLRPMALVAAAAGRHLCMTPLVPVLAAAAMLDCGAGAAAVALRAQLSDGAAVVPVLEGGFARGPSGGVRGDAAMVPGAEAAAILLVEVAASGLHAVGADSAGITVEARPTFDTDHPASVALDGRQGLGGVPLLDPAETAQAMARGRAVVQLGTAAELLGVVDAAFAMTLDYLRTRRQFGRAIGSFQALQHRAADHLVQIEVTRSLVFAAAALPIDAPGLPAAAAAAFARVAGMAPRVAQDCVQMHGAIGFTDEHDLGLHLKRALALSSRWGGARATRERYAGLTGLGV